MEGYNPFSALNKLKVFHFILFNADLCLHVLSRFGKMSQIRVSRRVHPDYYDITKGGSLKFITILQGGGGLPDLLQYYKGEGGVSRDPKFVLRNIWTAP